MASVYDYQPMASLTQEYSLLRKTTLQKVCCMSQQDYENGLKVRTEVMGESFVKRAQDNTVPFTQPLQDWIN